MPAIRRIRAPLCIYVIHHPACEVGPALARAIYDWFHAPSDDVHRSGLGLPVYYRSEPRRERPADWEPVTQGAPRTGPLPAPPPEINLDGADLNILVPLLDEHFVADPVLVDYVEGTATRRPPERPEEGVPSTLLLPVALHPGAFRLGPPFEGINFLRFEAGASRPSASGPDPEAVQGLLRQLTDACSRRVLGQVLGLPEGQVPPPVTLFLSHAKADGQAIAEQIRDRVSAYGQIRAFYDANDLPLGHPFGDLLDSEAALGTAAMLAIVTDRYAARPWCRRELRLARQPRPAPFVRPPGSGDGAAGEPAAPVWRNQPVVALDALDHDWTRAVPDLGNVPLVRWDPAKVDEVLDRTLLEVLLSAFHRLFAWRLVREYDRGREGARNYVSWVPDQASLARLRMELPEAAREPLQIVYPGHGISTVEREELGLLFPRLELATFEEVGTTATPGSGLVGLSVGDPDDLRSLGYGPEHLDELALRLARSLLRKGYDLAYGGQLLRGSPGFTDIFLQAAAAEQASQPPERRREGARLVGFQPWPRHLGLDSARVAEVLGTARFVRVDPDEAGDLPDPVRGFSSPREAGLQARALTRMRRCMQTGGLRATDGREVPAVEARIVVGGKILGWSGMLPGVVEEAVEALAADREEAGSSRRGLFVLGGYGGAARLLAEAFTHKRLPPELTFDWHKDERWDERNERFRLVVDALGEDAVRRAFARVEAVLAGAWADLEVGLGNGLTEDENLQLFESTNAVETIRLILRGLASTAS